MQIINFYAIIAGVGKQRGKIPTHGHTYPHIVNEMFDFCDWRLFFSKLFVPLKELSEPQGCVQLKKILDLLPAVNIGEETKFNVLIKGVSINDKLQLHLPVTFSGPGLLAEQQWYLSSYVNLAGDMCRTILHPNCLMLKGLVKHTKQQYIPIGVIAHVHNLIYFAFFFFIGSMCKWTTFKLLMYGSVMYL